MVMSQRPRSGGVPSDAEDVCVIYGIQQESLPLAGWTIAEARRALAERWSLAADAAAVVEGALAEESTVLAPGQVLAFVRRAGEIGSYVGALDRERHR